MGGLRHCYRLWLLSIFEFGQVALVDSTSQRVLFIGNSYTYVHDLPNTYKQVAEARLPGLHLTVASDASGSRTLGAAANVASVRSKVEAGDYDFLVLQEQSCLGGVPDGHGFPQRESSSAALKTFFGPTARKVGATVVLLETWGRPKGAPTSCGAELFDKTYPTFEAMQSKLTSSYDEYKQTLQSVGATVIVARVGEAFAKAKLLPNSADASSLFNRLYVGDPGGHPSELGQHLSANVVFEAINLASASLWKPVLNKDLQPALLGSVIYSSPTLAAMAGDWVGKYELQDPSTWRVRDGSVFQLVAGREGLQGFLSASGQWLDRRTRQPSGTNIVKVGAVTVWWSDGDVWTRVGPSDSIQQKFIESALVPWHVPGSTKPYTLTAIVAFVAILSAGVMLTISRIRGGASEAGRFKLHLNTDSE